MFKKRKKKDANFHLRRTTTSERCYRASFKKRPTISSEVSARARDELDADTRSRGVDPPAARNLHRANVQVHERRFGYIPQVRLCMRRFFFFFFFLFFA